MKKLSEKETLCVSIKMEYDSIEEYYSDCDKMKESGFHEVKIKNIKKAKRYNVTYAKYIVKPLGWFYR